MRNQHISFKFADQQGLCQICQSIEFSTSDTRLTDIADEYPQLTHLRERSSSCKLCALLLWTFRAKERVRPSFAASADGRKAHLRLLASVKVGKFYPLKARVSGSLELQVMDSVDDRPLAIPEHVRTVLSLTSGSRLGRVGPPDGLQFLAQTRALDEACVFYSRCKHKHRAVADHQSLNQRPTRLLCISNTDTVSLDVQKSNIVKYAALSYRWGPPPFVHNTTQANWRDRVTGFATDSLPRTIQDAITVARRLGLSYLWIDSLCIIQDDSLDWQAEAMAMDRVYQGADVVIAALDSEAVDQSFCYKPAGAQLDLSIASQSGRHMGNESIRVSAWPHDEYEFAATIIGRLISTSVWAERGWMMQEQLLSSRILYFTAGMVIFECSQGIWYGDDRHRLSKKPLPTSWVHNFLGHGRDINVGFPTLHPYQQWYEILMTYTSRDLTHSKDKLVAMQGVAKQIAMLEDDKLIHGLWERDLKRGILWTTRGGAASGLGSLAGPSWSWVSSGHRIYYSDWIFAPHVEYLAELEIHHEQTKDASATGEDSMTLKLTGTSLDVPERDLQLAHRGMFQADSGLTITYDESSAAALKPGLIMLPLLITLSKVSGRLAQALVLERSGDCVNDAVLYRRVGVAAIPEAHLTSGVRQTVNVI